jgi:hypothetical protein
MNVEMKPGSAINNPDIQRGLLAAEFTTITRVAKNTFDAPRAFVFSQNYPNPFNRWTERSRRNPTMMIPFTLPQPRALLLIAANKSLKSIFTRLPPVN